MPRRKLAPQLSVFAVSAKAGPSAAEARFIEVEPGVQILAHCHWQADRQNALTVIIVHGLEGSSDSTYMLGIAAKGLALGMNVVRMNQRNCGGTEALAPTLYHSGRSQDIAAVAQNLIEHDKISRLALAGYSMGGNLVLKLAGEWGGSGPDQFRAVAAVCPAVNLAASADALHLPSNRLYEQYFLWKLGGRLRSKALCIPAHSTSRVSVESAVCANSTTESLHSIVASPELSITTTVPPPLTSSIGLRFPHSF